MKTLYVTYLEIMDADFTGIKAQWNGKIYSNFDIDEHDDSDVWANQSVQIAGVDKAFWKKFKELNELSR